MSYQTLIHINEIDFSSKRVIIIGAGWMADQYCQALQAMGIRLVTVVSRKEESAKQCCQKYGYQPRHGGYRDVLPKLEGADLVIVATPVHELRPAVEFAVSLGFKTILVEKPGALYSEALLDWTQKAEKQDVRVRVAFNRQTYPSFWKLRELADSEGGMTSCHYTFTEWIHTIDFHNNCDDVYTRWGIANSLHVIAMAHALIGMPKSISTYRSGELTWHPAGERFTGAGVTEQGVLFSYHADWNSAGRWGIEVMTPQNAYRLIPLEKLFRCPKGSVNWEPVEIASAFPNVKEGVTEEIAIMLNKDLENSIPLVTLKNAADHAKLAENIFGYSSE
ncbi:MAG: Gfo/Idh/MocA family protein [Smithellaceae bacterium]